MKRPTYSSISRKVRRADEANERYRMFEQILEEGKARRERQLAGQTCIQLRNYLKEEMHRHAKRGGRRLLKLGLKRDDLAQKCLAAFVGYPVVQALISARDPDLWHTWQSIAQLRDNLNRPVYSGRFPVFMDEWLQRVLASYSDRQIEEELLTQCPGYIEGERRSGGVKEYLLP